jgi:uncharacterized protein (DUF849 family)
MIQACLNGRRTRNEHPNIPLTPEQLAREGASATMAGAQSLHVHPRAPDGAETFEPRAHAAAIGALRQACPGIEISVTTGFWVTGDAKKRLDAIHAWTELPDTASVNISEPGAADLCRVLTDLGIRVEVGIAGVDDARTLIKSGVAPLCTRVLIEIEGEPSGAIVEISAIDAQLEGAGIDLPKLEHGYGRATWAILDRAFRLGHDVRIGFEDTLVFADGQPAKTNGELVEACLQRLESGRAR